jgi:hypothetical protein
MLEILKGEYNHRHDVQLPFQQLYTAHLLLRILLCTQIQEYKNLCQLVPDQNQLHFIYEYIITEEAAHGY